MAEHHLIQNGDGCYCTVCGISWDQDEERGQCDDLVHPNDVRDSDLPATPPPPLVIGTIAFGSNTNPELAERAADIMSRMLGGDVTIERLPHVELTPGKEPPRRQMGGDHYQAMGIQPREFAIRNRYDPDAFSILKYLSRHRRKAGVEDVEKAKHFAEMRLRDFETYDLARWPKWAHPQVSMAAYINANGITNTFDQNALFSLQNWVTHGFGAAGTDCLMHIEILLAQCKLGLASG